MGKICYCCFSGINCNSLLLLPAALPGTALGPLADLRCLQRRHCQNTASVAMLFVRATLLYVKINVGNVAEK